MRKIGDLWSLDDAPRGLGFLLDRKWLNVAISRGKSVCYLFHSKHLLSASFRSIEDVKAVSRLTGLENRSVITMVSVFGIDATGAPDATPSMGFFSG